MMKKLNLKKLFNRYPKMETAISMEVKVINPDSEKLDELFGIPIRRSDELAEKIFLAVHDPRETRASIIVEMSKLCTHPNELAYVAMAIQSAYDFKNNPLRALSQLFTK